MDPVEQDWHTYNDCILKTCNTLIEDGIVTPEEVKKMWDDLDAEITKESQKAVANFTPKTKEMISDLVYTYDFEDVKARWKKFRDATKNDRKKKYKEFHEKGYFATPVLQVENTQVRLLTIIIKVFYCV